MAFESAESSHTRAPGASTPLVRELARPWNLMSLVRLPLAVAVIAAREHLSIVLGLMVLAAVSDALDGAMARRAGASSAIGAWLDPVCDKAFVLALLIAIWVVREPPWWLLALSAVRELVVVPMVLAHLLAPGRRGRRIEYRARPSGKATTVAQFIVIAAVLFGRLDVAAPASVAAALIGLWAGVEYGLRARRTMGRAA